MVIWHMQPMSISLLPLINSASHHFHYKAWNSKIGRLIRALYRMSVGCVCASQSESAWFTIESGVHHVRVLAPDFFATTSVHWLLKRTWHGHECIVIWSTLIFRYGFLFLLMMWLSLLNYLNFCTCIWDDGLKVNWQKTKVQALSKRIWEICMSWLLCPINNFQGLLTSHVPMPSLCSYAKPRQSDLEVRSPSPPSWSCIAFYPFSCTALSAGQLSREMYSRLMLSINGGMVPPCAEWWVEMDN